MDAADARELLVLLSDSDAWHLILAECRHTSEAENRALRGALFTQIRLASRLQQIVHWRSLDQTRAVK
jgi:hypothetical protein